MSGRLKVLLFDRITSLEAFWSSDHSNNIPLRDLTVTQQFRALRYSDVQRGRELSYKNIGEQRTRSTVNASTVFTFESGFIDLLNLFIDLSIECIKASLISIDLQLTLPTRCQLTSVFVGTSRHNRKFIFFDNKSTTGRCLYHHQTALIKQWYKVNKRTVIGAIRTNVHPKLTIFSDYDGVTYRSSGEYIKLLLYLILWARNKL